MNTIIKLRCIDQVLTFESTPRVASGGVGEDLLSVSFCSLWDGLTKTAVFWRTEDEVYHVALDTDGTCTIPHEVLAEEGVIYFGLFGVSTDGLQRTSEVMRYRVERGAITSGTKPSDPTPELYQQVLALCAGAQNAMALAEENAARIDQLEESGGLTWDDLDPTLEAFDARLVALEWANSMPTSGGTFTGEVKAGAGCQDPNASLLRNSKLVSTETDPTYNGEIHWFYE